MGVRVAGGIPLAITADGVTPIPGGLRFDGANAIAASTTAEPILVERVGSLALHVSCPATGSPNGSFAIQGTNDASDQEGNMKPNTKLVNWATLSFFDEATGLVVQSKAVVGAQSVIASIPVVTVRWLRFVWTNTNGSALLTVKPETKAVS